MKTKETPNIQRLESLDDLGALIPGDVVELFFEYHPKSYCEEKLPFVYSGDSHSGQKQFITPKFSQIGNLNYILMHRAFPKKIELRNGVVVLSEDFSATETFSPSPRGLGRDREYEALKKFIIDSGLA